MPKKSRKNGSGEGSIRKKGNGRWEARFTIGHDPISGKQIQKSVYGKTREETSKKLNEILNSVSNGTFVEPSKMKTGEWIESWLNNYAKMAIKESTFENYSVLTKVHILPRIGSITLNNLKTKDLQQFYNNIFESGKAPRKSSSSEASGLSVSTIKHIHNIIHQSLAQALKEGLIRSNTDEACVMPKAEKKKINTLPMEDISLFLNEASKGNHYSMYYLDLCTGLRRGELLGLKWEDIDFVENTLIIKRQLTRMSNKLILSSLKTQNSYRTVKIPDSAIDVLKSHQEFQNVLKEKAGMIWEESGLIFCNEIGKPLDPSGVYHNFKRLIKRLGFNDNRFHDLRHTFATISLQNGVDIKTIQESLGHSNAAFTLQVYGHVSKQMQNTAAKKIDDFMIAQTKENTDKTQ
jgi:integrase